MPRCEGKRLRAGFWGLDPKQVSKWNAEGPAGFLRARRGTDHHPGLLCGSDTLPSLLTTPCVCRKYLRDADRQVLAQRAFILTVKVLEDTLSELAEVRHPQPLSSPRSWHRPCHSHTGAFGRSPVPSCEVAPSYLSRLARSAR